MRACARRDGSGSCPSPGRSCCSRGSSSSCSSWSPWRWRPSTRGATPATRPPTSGRRRAGRGRLADRRGRRTPAGPDGDPPAVRRAGARRRRRRLRRGDGPGPHPLHPPDRVQHRQAVHRRPRRRAGGRHLHPGVRRARSARRCARSCRSKDGDDVVALVSVGITIASIDEQLREDVALVLLVALAVLAAGLLGAWLVSRRLRRQTHGMGEREITRMYEYYSAVLHAVREGLLLVDADGRVQLVNDEATPAAGASTTTSSGGASTSSASRRAWSPPRSARRRSPTTCTSPATASSSSARRRPAGTGATSVPSSPCATTPSCGR